jgi:hypothetical protein
VHAFESLGKYAQGFVGAVLATQLVRYVVVPVDKEGERSAVSTEQPNSRWRRIPGVERDGGNGDVVFVR